MSMQENTRKQWNSFFDSFSRQHEGWLATLEVFAADAGAQPEAQEQPFEGISLDSGDGEPASVIISFGKSPSDDVTHTIHQATNLWLQQTAEGADASLEIKAGDNSNTLLRFRSPMLPNLWTASFDYQVNPENLVRTKLIEHGPYYRPLFLLRALRPAAFKAVS